MDVAEIVRAVDDPEFFVAGREVEDLFVVGENDECRKTQLGTDGNDFFARVGHDARAFARCRSHGRERQQQSNADNRRTEILSR